MGAPFKINPPGKGPPGSPERQTVPNAPKLDDQQVNGEQVDLVPDREPIIEWPPAGGPDDAKSPMRLK